MREQELDLGAGFPNKNRTVVLIHVMRRIKALFKRFEPVMDLIVNEVIGCVYATEDSAVTGWTDDDLYARMTWFEKCQGLKMQMERYRGAVEEEDDNEVRITSFKESLGHGFKCMLDPSTRVLRRAMFNGWHRFTKQQKAVRSKFIVRGCWRVDHELLRKVFNNLLENVRVSLRERIVAMKKKLNKSAFEKNFSKKDRHDAAGAIQLLLDRASGESP